METQYIRLNMTPNGITPIFHISQFDVGRTLGFFVYNNSEVVDLDNYTVTVEATRNDGTPITVLVVTNDNIGTFEVTETMTRNAGKYAGQLVIVDSSQRRIASLPFMMDVTASAMDESSVGIAEDKSLYQQYNIAVEARLADLQNNISSEASTRASADTLLGARIDEIVAPSGEAPSAAEVLDARIGADGVTYPSLGAAIRTQINNDILERDYDAIKLIELSQNNEEIELFDANLIYTGIYIGYYDGEAGTNANFFATGFIPVKPNMIINVTGGSQGSQVAFFDAKRQFVSGSLIHTASSFIIPNTSTIAFMRWSNVLTSLATSSLKTYRSYAEYMPENMINLLSGKGYDLITSDRMIDGYYCNYNNGVLETSSTFCVTSLLPVKKNMRITVTGGAQGTQVAFYNASGTFVSGALVRSANIITVPDNDNIAYMRWCTLIANKNNISLKVYDIQYDDTLVITPTKGILEGVIEAYNKGHHNVMVEAGNYDLIQEYKDYYGSDCWDNYSSGYNATNMGVYGRGIWIDGLSIKFMAGAKVVAKYTGNNDNVKTYFSAFAMGSNGEIDGLNADCENIRYCIHPDFHPNEESENITIKNCELRKYGGVASIINEAIGCGFGVHSIVTIDNCIIHSDGNYRVLRIHNVSDADSLSKGIVKNCYIDGNGYMSFNSNGLSQEKSLIEVCGCSWINPAVIGSESGAQYVNMEMLAWNNETRQQ